VSFDPISWNCDSEIDKDLYRGNQLWTPSGGRGVYGGQIIAQSVWAASLTESSTPPKQAHSMHCYFLLPGNSEVPAVYSVKRVREGRSFSTRSVVTRQRGRAIFASLISFHNASEPTTLHHAEPMPSVARPETLPNVSCVSPLLPAQTRAKSSPETVAWDGCQVLLQLSRTWKAVPVTSAACIVARFDRCFTGGGACKGSAC
jgi:acyl-CoA thioesterase II